MALQTVVDTLDGLPEVLHEHYEKTTDGKFRLSGVEDVSGLKSALAKEKEERRAAKAQLEKLSGIDPEKYQTLLTEAEQREAEKLTRKGEYDKILNQVNEKHQQELATRDGDKQRLQGALEKNVLNAQAIRAISAAKPMGGSPDLMLPHVMQHLRMVEEDGEFVARVVGKDGKTPRIGDANGSLMTIDQLVAEMKASDVYGYAFEGSGASGSGTTHSNGGGAANKKTWTSSQFETASQSDRMAFFKAGGVVKE